MLKLVEWYEDGRGIEEEIIGEFETEEELKEYLKKEGLSLYCEEEEEGRGVREEGYELLWYEF